jgi:PAS domain S-box-containing protein
VATGTRRIDCAFFERTSGLCDECSRPEALAERGRGVSDAGDSLLAASRDADAIARSVMARAIEAFDWSRTPLGASAQWPASLKCAVRLMLGSRYPMFLWWGESLTALYNDAYIDVLGARHPWALGLSAREIWAEIWNVVGPQAEAVLREGRSTWNDRVLLVMQRQGFTEETYFTFSYSPAFDDAGRVGGVFCACTEDTERVLGERRLQSLRALSDATLEARSVEQACRQAATALAGNAHDLPFALIYLVAEGGCAQLAAATGAAPDAPFAAGRVPLDADAAWPLAEVMSTKLPQTVDDVDKRWPPIAAGPWPQAVERALVLPLPSPNASQLAGFLVSGLTPRRPLDQAYRDYLALVAQRVAAAMADAQAFEAEQQRVRALAEIDRAKTAFFSNVSHELRTPLALMLGPIGDLLGSAGRSLEDAELLALAQRNGRRLQRLVNSLLDFSRLEAGRLAAHFEPVELAAFTAELASVFRSAIERAGLDLVIDCPPLREPVYVDRTLWEKIVFNLLSNALKYTQHGVISVRLAEEGDCARLDVVDTGIGVPAAALPRVFERFFRVESTAARSIEGSGIGLALVAELARLHGGSAQVRSREGAGSTFSVRLPFGMQHLPAAQVHPASIEGAPSLAQAFVDEAEDWLRDTQAEPLVLHDGRTDALPALGAARGTVLVADDNADMRGYLLRLLGGEHAVLAAADGEEALRLARERKPDLVLTDVMMPRLDGFGLLRALRQDDATASLPVILLSARAGEEARLEGLEAGADDYQTKPFNARELRARVSGALALGRARREAARHERALRSEMENVLESITEGFVAVDAHWRFTYVNAAAEKMYSMPRQALLGRELWEVFPELAGSPFEASYRRAMSQRARIDIEGSYDGIDGWFDVHVYPIDGGGLSFYFRNVLEQRRQEEALREAELRHRFLSQMSRAQQDLVEPQQLLDTAMDMLGRHLEADRCLYAYIDERSRKVEVLGSFVRDGMPSLLGTWQVDDFGLGQLQSYREGLPFVIDDIDADARAAPTRAAFRDVLTAASLSAGVLRKGEVVAMIGVHQRSPRHWRASEVALVQAVAARCWEALERARTQREQRETEQRFRELADAMPQIVYVTDGDGRVEFLNRQWQDYTGQQGANLLDVPAVVHPDDRARLHEKWESAVRGARAMNAEFRLRSARDGSYRWFLTRAVPVRDASGRITRWFGTSTDIDSQKRSAEQLRQAHEALQQADLRKDHFIATLAHELRNPLAPLRNAVQLLHLSSAPATVSQVRAMMQRQVDLLVRLVDDLLEVSRISTGKVELQRTSVDLLDVLSSAIETSRPLVESGQHRLSMEVAEAGRLIVDGDAVRLAQVFANLLNNAAKYTDPGGRIELIARQEGTQAVVRFRDNGAGIAPKMLSEVFEPFVQADRSASRSQGGMGIGLALVRSLVMLHGGSVEAQSAGHGRGSEFVVRLPLREGAAAALPADVEPVALADGRPPPRVLVVDDNRDAADSLANLLGSLGAEVRIAYDGHAALAAVAEHPPHIVLLDLGMPGMDGFEVARRLADRPQRGEFRLVALTGWGQQTDRERTRKAGFDDHLVKPLQLPLLRALLVAAQDGQELAAGSG